MPEQRKQRKKVTKKKKQIREKTLSSNLVFLHTEPTSLSFLPLLTNASPHRFDSFPSSRATVVCFSPSLSSHLSHITIPPSTFAPVLQQVFARLSHPHPRVRDYLQVLLVLFLFLFSCFSSFCLPSDRPFCSLFYEGWRL